MAGATAVLVPGGFTGAWMWAEVAALLEGEHIDVVTLELPKIGQDSAGADFYADARAVRENLDRLGPPVVLCGHSYGGAVRTGSRSNCSFLLYVVGTVWLVPARLAGVQAARQGGPGIR